MTTTAFRNLRSLTQLLSVLLILINIPLPILLLLNFKFVQIETTNLGMGIFSLTGIFKLTVLCNITLGMFASCGISSKVKMYMRMYLTIAFLYIIVSVALILYVKKLYWDEFINFLNTKANMQMSTKFIIEGKLDCKMANKSCENVLQEHANLLIKYYLMVAFVSLGLTLVNFILIKIALSVNMEKPATKIPKFVQITKAGMNTSSLRHKRVIDTRSEVAAV